MARSVGFAPAVTIPVRNLYYLFCYAWERFPAGGTTEVGIDDCPDLPNLFARVLLNGTNRLLRRGLDRGYIAYEDELRSPRGRILIEPTLKEQTLLRGTAYCHVDELQHDVLHNRIIKATATALSLEPSLARSFAHDLRVLCQRFSNVSDIRLGADSFRRVQLFRNNAQYASLIRLCEFVWRALLPEEDGRGGRFADILGDEERMSRVFEDFLRGFYAHEQPTYTVAREDMRWRISAEDPADAGLIPIMRTDVTLRSPSATIVMDAKFYADPFPRSSSGVEKLRSSHLYQLYAYMKHASERNPGAPVRGALVYASPAGSTLRRYQMDGHSIAIAALDLSQPWFAVHNQLVALLDCLSVGEAALELS